MGRQHDPRVIESRVDVESSVGNGLPFDGESTGLFYRTDLFQAAGITSPPTTWEELQADAAKLTIPSKKQYGWIIFGPESAYYWYPFL